MKANNYGIFNLINEDIKQYKIYNFNVVLVSNAIFQGLGTTDLRLLTNLMKTIAVIK